LRERLKREMNVKVGGSKFFKERFFWIGFSITLIIVILVLILNILDYKRKLTDSQDSLIDIQQSAKEREKILSEDIQSLRARLQNYGILAHFTGLSFDGLSYREVEELRGKGLKDPINDLIADLRKHRDLIPYKAVLGGTMNFYFEDLIHVLSSKNVLAYFEDGHIGGHMLLEYHVLDGGKISWKVIDSLLY